jgi:hypothetical protein
MKNKENGIFMVSDSYSLYYLIREQLFDTRLPQTVNDHYNALKDPHLQSHFSKEAVKQHLFQMGLVLLFYFNTRSLLKKAN